MTHEENIKEIKQWCQVVESFKRNDMLASALSAKISALFFVISVLRDEHNSERRAEIVNEANGLRAIST